MTINSYRLGSMSTLTGKFYSDAAKTVLADPTTVTLSIRDPQGVITTPTATHASLGTWTYSWTPLVTGLHEVRWAGTGAIVAADQEAAFVLEGVNIGANLCTVEDVRLFLQKEAADTTQDPVIGTVITSVSQQINEYCSREFAPATTAATRRIRVDSPYVSLAPYDLRTATTVTLNPEDSSPSILAANTDYVLEPTNGGLGGTYTSIRLAASRTLLSTFAASFGYAQLDILGDWGMASVPADVKQACIEAVAIRLRRDVSAFSTVFNLDESRLERPEALPHSVCQALRQYKRMLV